MTSEVVVMNTLAVALAADSAATIDGGASPKTYNSANKLFMLSKRHPVGAMVYSSASLLGVPWELIIKMFRRKLGTTEFAELADYGAALIDYLNGNERFFPADVQKKYYLALVKALYAKLYKRITKSIWAVHGDAEAPFDTEIAQDEISKELKRWQDMPDITCFAPDIGLALVSKHSGEIYNLGQEFSARLFMQLDQTAMKMLRALADLVVSKDGFLDGEYSGIVIAGYGRDEHFPVVQTFQVGEVYENRLKHNTPAVQKIDHDVTSHLQPFAQSEMIENFVFGVNPDRAEQFLNEVNALLDELPDADDVTLEPHDWAKIFDRCQNVRTVRDTLIGMRRRRTERIREAISMMPKDELGHAAASLVSLNSFRQRVSTDRETVGGPIDVAVISKEDGFIWIDRKHYFRRELNQRFFDNYYTDVDELTENSTEKGGADNA